MIHIFDGAMGTMLQSGGLKAGACPELMNIEQPEVVPERQVWMGPMENWEEIVNNNAQNFMLKFYISRNIMMFFTIFLCIGLLIA